MFEREITDSMFIQRWGIVRTLVPQSVAEHTFAVTHYANDIAVYLGLTSPMHLRLLQRSLWHDARDEIFTGDLPGPNKRGLLNAIGPGAKAAWTAKLNEWASRTFDNLLNRSGGDDEDPGAELIELILKTADWLEAAVRMATEAQLGNGCAVRHIVPNMNGAIETAKKVCEFYCGERVSDHGDSLTYYTFLVEKITSCVYAAQHSQSAGPWITKEDDNRQYHDPALGDPTVAPEPEVERHV